MYRKTKAIIACSLLSSRDPITQQVASIQTQKEELQQRAVFCPMLVAREVMAANPGGKHQTLMKCTRKLVEAEDAEERLDHTK